MFGTTCLTVECAVKGYVDRPSTGHLGMPVCNSREDTMRRILTAVMLATLPTLAAAETDLVLRGMGSFHVGGRLVEISGQPVKEVVFTPGGVPAKVDPNGTYQTEQMYVQ
jgi:hypothetical protein